MKLYGIRNCDTVKKARKWLDDAGIDYEFHDFKKNGLDTDRLSHGEQVAGWEVLLNRRGTTWRKLPDEVRDNISAQSAHDLMLDNPSIIKRPILQNDKILTAGFKANEWQALLK